MQMRDVVASHVKLGRKPLKPLNYLTIFAKKLIFSVHEGLLHDVAYNSATQRINFALTIDSFIHRISLSQYVHNEESS